MYFKKLKAKLLNMDPEQNKFIIRYINNFPKIVIKTNYFKK